MTISFLANTATSFLARVLGAALLVFVVAILALPASAHAQTPPGPIYTIDASGALTSATVGYIRRALHEAESANATALIITLSSNGGVLRDVRPLADEIAAATIPIVVYVAPEGTTAGASGALLLSAAHVSAMAPSTSFGSPYPLAQIDSTLSDQTRLLVQDSVVDDLRHWNAAQGRNTTWIQRAVSEGVILSNEQAVALDPPAINLVAATQQQLLTQLDGRTAKLANNRVATLSTLGRATTPLEPTLWEALSMLLTDPTIALVLLVLGALAICVEFAAPGTSVFAGMGLVLVGAATVGLWTLPLHSWALLLVIVGLILIGVEFGVPVHGASAIIGLALLVVGALNLVDTTQAPGVGVSGWSVGLLVLPLAALIGLGVWLMLRSRAAPVITGQAAVVGKLAEVRRRLDPEGMVFVEGALWQAISEEGPVEAGDWVRVTAMYNLRLIVQPLVEADTRSSEPAKEVSSTETIA